MRLKTSNVCCAYSWSPASLGTPPMIAMASYDGAVGDDFSNEAFLEIRLVDVTRTDETDMSVVGRIPIPDRACRVDWSPHTGAQGIIAVACRNGDVYIYSASAVLDGGATASPLLWTISEHRSPTRGCQFNPSQPNFLATGDESGQWFLWSFPKTASPTSQPQKMQLIKNTAHTTAIVHLQWHPKYPHIIATASANGTVNVWNLKTTSLAISLNVAKASKGAGVTCIAWNPTVSTQLAVGLDDAHPVVQMWDLKRSISPIREMAAHTRGISGLAWSAQDTSMLASCGGEGRTMWWDPNTGEKSGELQAETTYIVDVQWCPALQGVLATSSFEPLFCVSTAQNMATANGEVGAVPKWLVRPCGASINIANCVASLVPGTTASVQVTRITTAPMSPTSSADVNMKRELAQLPPGSPERAHWLQQNNYGLLAAATSCRSDRQPLLAYLSESSQQQEQQNNAADEEDPFAELSQEHQKSVEDRVSEQVASGRIEEAVDICLDSARFADAFALAFLRGSPLMMKVHQRYIQHVTMSSEDSRHVLIAGAIASGDFTALVQRNVPWREALSAVVAYVGDGFTDACNQLGDALRDQGNMEGAYASYVCGRNVDAVVDLWQRQGLPSRKVVQDVVLLEETTERASRSPYLAQCFCDYGLKLVSEGHSAEAVEYLQRAANIGDQTAAVLVDRMRYAMQLPKNILPQAPFRTEPIVDHPSHACNQHFAMLQERHMPQQQQQQQQQQVQQPRYPPQQQQMQQPPQHQQQQQYPAAPQAPQQSRPPQQQMPPMSAGPSQPYAPPQQQQQPMPGAPSQPYAPPQQQPPPPGAYPQQQQPFRSGSLNATPHAQAPYAPPAQAQAPAPAPLQRPAPPALPVSRPPLVAATSGAPAPAPHRDPYGAAPPPPGQQLGARPNPMPVGPPQPRLMPHPVSAYSSMRNDAAAPPQAPPPRGPPPPQQNYAPPASSPGSREHSRAMAPSPYPVQPYQAPASAGPPPPPGVVRPPSQPQPGAGYPASASNGYNPASAGPPPPPPGAAPPPQQQQQPSPTHQQIMQRLQQIIPFINDAPRRSAVEGAAAALSQQLFSLPDELQRMLLAFVNSAGTPLSRDVWADITARHGNAIGAFANLRYL